jgi:hypothetical protein
MFVQTIFPDNTRSHVADCTKVKTSITQNVLCVYSRVWYVRVSVSVSVSVSVPENPQGTFQGIEPVI